MPVLAFLFYPFCPFRFQIWERVTTRGLLFEASKDAQLPRTLRQGCEERAERPKEL
jgi:hypothetical protein